LELVEPHLRRARIDAAVRDVFLRRHVRDRPRQRVGVERFLRLLVAPLHDPEERREERERAPVDGLEVGVDVPALGRRRRVRGIAAIYLVAFVCALNQFRPLLGERGLLPVPRFLARARFTDSPSLFHLRYSDRIAAAVALAGIAISGAALLGLTEAGPLWLSV